MANTDQDGVIQSSTATSVDSVISPLVNTTVDATIQGLTSYDANTAILATTFSDIVAVIQGTTLTYADLAIEGMFSYNVDHYLRVLAGDHRESAIFGKAGASLDAVIRGRKHLITPDIRVALRSYYHYDTEYYLTIPAFYGEQRNLAVLGKEALSCRLVISGSSSSKVVKTFTSSEMNDVSPSVSHDEIFTALRVLYKFDYALGEYEGSILLEAPEEILKFGRIEKTIELIWCPSARQAISVGTRYLKYLARPRWQIEFNYPGNLEEVEIGSPVYIVNDRLPVFGDMTVLIIDFNTENNTTNITVEHIFPKEAIIEVAETSELTPAVTSTEGIQYIDGIAYITIEDDQGNPMVGATVTLDGDYSQVSNSSGEVAFETDRGGHTLKVEKDGFVPVEIGITI